MRASETTFGWQLVIKHEIGTVSLHQSRKTSNVSAHAISLHFIGRNKYRKV